MKVLVKTPHNKLTVGKNSTFTARMFLAGGCTGNWRENVIHEGQRFFKSSPLVKHITGNFEMLSPKTDCSKIKFINLLKWEHDAILNSDFLVINFEGSESLQPGTIYELGRFAYESLSMGNRTLFININPNYKLNREVTNHIRIILADIGYSKKSIERLFENSTVDDCVHISSYTNDDDFARSIFEKINTIVLKGKEQSFLSTKEALKN